MTFDDVGPLPPELEDVVQMPGWHIVPSGLPVLVTHATEELELERSLWDVSDWCWLAVFVKVEVSKGLPKAGDVWVQVMAMETEKFETAPKNLAEIDEELVGKHDTVMVLHVDELPKNLLTEPMDYFKEPVGGEVAVPEGNDAGGIGEDPMEVVGEGRTHEREQADEIEELEGVRLEEATPLKELKQLCDKMGLPKSGGKPKVLRRLRDHYEILEKRLSAEIARKMYQEAERIPEMPKLPKLPSVVQQQLHNVTHHPFAAWCEACVLGRSKQSAHPKASPEEPVEEARKVPKIEIDYCYTFTKHRHELQEGEEAEPKNEEERAGGDADDAARRAEGNEPENKAADPEDDKVDYRDQYGLTLVAAESSTGWLLAIPVLEKGAGALKRVVEQLVRLSLQVAPGQAVLFQGDPEPSIRQIINACEACRSRLGLATEKRWVPRASHASNGQAEKAIQTIRTNGLTLRSFVEARIGASIEGHRHFYPWVMRHAGFLYNRFSVNPRGATSYELMHGRAFRGQLVPLGEQVLYYRPSKHRGDLQWCRGIWLGIHERNGAHLIGTAEGINETRSIRRLPEEQQWSATALLGMKGLPWSYMGRGKRKRPLYTGAAATRVPRLPDSSTLEELARAAGRAAAEAISSGTPVPPSRPGPGPGPDEAGSDPSSSPSCPSSREGAAREPDRPHEESQQRLQAQGGDQRQQEREPGRPHEESRQRLQAQGGAASMDTSGTGGVPRERPDEVGVAVPKRPRLLLDRPEMVTPSPAASPGASSSLYPPGYAGVNQVCDDIPGQELAGLDTWDPEVEEVLEEEWYNADGIDEAWWDEFGEKPPR